jgi:XRE family aerobic/anaerobic benzoate catabolism transcriptional regulator
MCGGQPPIDRHPYDPVVADDGDARLCAAFGAHVRTLRVRRKLSRTVLATNAGISLTYLAEIERGERNPTLAVVARLARALDTKPSDLVAQVEDVS